MSYGADVSYAVYNENVRKARKAHVCSACKLAIAVGDFYCAVRTIYDGDVETFKRCGACQTTHLHLRKLCADAGNMWPREDLSCGLSYESEWESEPPDEIAALPFLSEAERGSLLKPAKAE